MLNKHWGLVITGFFCDCRESVKTLHQFVHLAINSYSYATTLCLINVQLMENIFSGHSSYIIRSNSHISD